MSTRPPASTSKAAPAAQRTPAPATETTPVTPLRVDSASLMGGQRMLEIVHLGEVYRLQTTRLGKLILTK